MHGRSSRELVPLTRHTQHKGQGGPGARRAARLRAAPEQTVTIRPTYIENFRCTKTTFNLLVDKLAGSTLDGSASLSTTNTNRNGRRMPPVA